MKIVFTGPECTGKTTLCELTAAHFAVPYVREVSRDYLHKLQREYSYEDVLNISLLQMAEEEKIRSMHPSLLLCDTDILTIKIWCEDKFHKCEKWLNDACAMRHVDLYFLCAPDFPWQTDVLREDPQRREELFQFYKRHLIQNKMRFVELHGSIEKRMQEIYEYLSLRGGMF